MKTVVVRDYPAERLPEDVRRGIDPHARVDITISQPAPIDPAGSEPFDIMSLFGAGRGLYRDEQDVVDSIRALRDEWD